MPRWRTVSDSKKYQVSDDGDIRGPSGRTLKPTLLQIGYYSIAISLGNHKVVRRYIHRLVAEAFIGEIPQGSVVNHKNHDKLDNHLENLEIVNRKQNAEHWARKGRSKRAGRKRTGYCGRGHRLEGDRIYCNECRRITESGGDFPSPEDTEWRETTVTGYLVSSDGRLWSTKTKRLLRPGKNKPGYHYFNLRTDAITKPFALHRLVAEAFLRPLSDSEVVDHVNGDKLDNRLANLKITTRSGNTGAFRDRVRAEGNHGYKLSENEVKMIRRLLEDGELTQKEIGALFSVGSSLISTINTGRKWAHVQ